MGSIAKFLTITKKISMFSVFKVLKYRSDVSSFTISVADTWQQLF